MKTIDAFGDLKSMGQPVLTTREAATRMGTSSQNAGRRLRSLEAAGLVQRIQHGLWSLDTDIEPFLLPAYLTSPYPSYVSMWSALAHHDMIEQIPRQISVASLDRARRIQTTVGIFAIHHLAPEVFGGFETHVSRGFIAKPEKALFDVVYVRSAARSKAYFSELTLPRAFDQKELSEWVDRIGSVRLRTTVSRRIEAVLDSAEGSPTNRVQL